jgi:hypothetical protein
MIGVLFALAGTASADCGIDRGATLFERGRRTMEGGDYLAAYRLFRESYACDETRTGRLFAEARAADLAGNIAVALPLYEAYLLRFVQMAPEDHAEREQRAQIARARIRAIRLEAPRLTLTLAAHAPPGARVELDGREVPGSSLGTAILVNPGEHVATARAPQGHETTAHVSLARGEQRAIVLDVKATRATMDPSVRARRIGAYVVGGVSLAALAVGVIAAAVAVDRTSRIKCNLEAKTCATQGDLDYLFKTQDIARASTVSSVAGLTGLGTVALLLLTEPRHADGKAQAGRGAMLVFRRAW